MICERLMYTMVTRATTAKTLMQRSRFCQLIKCAMVRSWIRCGIPKNGRPGGSEHWQEKPSFDVFFFRVFRVYLPKTNRSH